MSEPAVESQAGAEPARHALLFDLDGLDLSRTVADRTDIERINPHRHEMALLDEVLHIEQDGSKAVGVHRAAEDAFWVRGHFPTRATLPGVIMIEAGAQLACYMWNAFEDEPRVAAFLRIDDATFRRAVVPGESMMLLAQEVKRGRRRFVTDLQGLVDGELTFTARITGLAMEAHRG